MRAFSRLLIVAARKLTGEPARTDVPLFALSTDTREVRLEPAPMLGLADCRLLRNIGDSMRSSASSRV